MRRQALTLLATGLLLLGGCGDKIDAVQLEESCPDPGVVTFENAIADFVAANCQRCHSAQASGTERNGAPVFVNYDTYAETERSASQALSRVISGSMPPDQTLSACDRAVFSAWVEQGKLEK